jgi:hypothetical protein
LPERSSKSAKLDEIIFASTYCSRSSFDSNGLIYSAKTNSWRSPSSCVWAHHRIELPGKLSLASEYKGLDRFFIDLLGVPKPSLHMHVMALVQKSENNASKDAILQEMMNICALGPTCESLKSLSDCKCLPIKEAETGQVVLMDRSAHFAILDRREYGEIFNNSIKMMDFTLEQVHALSPFLKALSLENKYISRQIKEKTKVLDGSFHSRLTDDFRSKAYAICR